MTCPICKKELEKGTNYCPACGCHVKPEETKPIREKGDANENEATLLSYYGAFAPTKNTTPPKKKPRGKKIAVCILASVFLFATLLLIFWENLAGIVLRSFSEPAEYFSYVEKKSLGKDTKNLSEFYVDFLKEIEKQRAGQTTDISFHLDQERLENVSPDLTKGDLAQLVSWLDCLKITLDSDYSLEKGILQNRFTLETGKNQIGTVKLLLKEGEEKGLIAIPGITEETLVFPIENSTPSIDRKRLPAAEEVVALLNRYGTIIYQILSEDALSLKKGAYVWEGGSKECFLISFDVTVDDLVKVTGAIVKEIESDGEFKAFFQKLEDAGILIEGDYDSFVAGVQKLHNEIEREYSQNRQEGNIVLFRITNYVSSRNEILGREIVSEEMNFTLRFFSDSSRMDLQLIADDVSLGASGKVKGTKALLEGEVVIAKEEMLCFTLEVEKKVSLFGGRGDTELQLALSLGEGSKNLLDDSVREGTVSPDLAAFLKRATFELESEAESNRNAWEFSVRDGEDCLFSVNYESRIRENGEVDEFCEDTAMKSVDRWLETWDLEKLKERLKASGLSIPSDLSGELAIA